MYPAADTGFVSTNSSTTGDRGTTGDEWGFDESPTDDFSAPDEGNEWGTFEEADYGFTEEPGNDDWSDLADSVGDGVGVSSIFGIISDIFRDS